MEKETGSFQVKALLLEERKKRKCCLELEIHVSYKNTNLIISIFLWSNFCFKRNSFILSVIQPDK